MFCPHKNSYLQLVCAMNPRIINKAVDRAMQREHFDPHTEIPPIQRLESMMPAMYAPQVDVTRARLGFGRVGLRLINRDLHSPDKLVQLQALHSVLDQVQISENAIFLINLHVVYRLVDLMKNSDPVIREKVCLTLTSLTNYHQGRQRMMSRPQIITQLLWLILRDRKEIRYAAAYTLRSLTRDRCSSEMILRCDNIIRNLLKMVKHDYAAIVQLHLKTLENLIEWDQVEPLKENAFQIMLKLFENACPEIVSGAMDCMTQLCKHAVGMKLADDYDLNFVLKGYLLSTHIEIRISAVGLLAYTTLTTRSKWRAKEFCDELTERLVNLCHRSNKPLLQLRAMQVLVNLCDCPDIRHHMKRNWEDVVRAIGIRTHEQWDGTSETTSYGCEYGHNYRTKSTGVETIKNEDGDSEAINVHSYIKQIYAVKVKLLHAINWKSYVD